MPADVISKREIVLEKLLEERGWVWPDGTPASPDIVRDAAENPWAYNIDEETAEDLVKAADGDVGAIVRLRVHFGLLPL